MKRINYFKFSIGIALLVALAILAPLSSRAQINDNKNITHPDSSYISIMTNPTCPKGFITITDLDGKKIATAPINNGKALFNTSGYTTGRYLYVVTDMNGNTAGNGKLAIQGK